MKQKETRTEQRKKKKENKEKEEDKNTLLKSISWSQTWLTWNIQNIQNNNNKETARCSQDRQTRAEEEEKEETEILYMQNVIWLKKGSRRQRERQERPDAQGNKQKYTHLQLQMVS